jgi:hypothetical protein
METRRASNFGFSTVGRRLGLDTQRHRDFFVTADKVLVRVASIENLVVWDPETAAPEDLLI